MTLLTLWMMMLGMGHASASDVMAEFKGPAAIDAVLRERLYTDAAQFSLAKFLGEKGDYYKGLTGLLGSYGGGGLDNTYQNGLPNVVNMILWHVALTGLSDQIGANCYSADALAYHSADALTYNETFAAALKVICNWPAPTAKTDDALMNFWLVLMSFDAPMSEFAAWKDFFLTSAYKDAKAQEAVAAMVLAMLNNPYFLLGE